jgi:hypothetical protein
VEAGVKSRLFLAAIAPSLLASASPPPSGVKEAVQQIYQSYHREDGPPDWDLPVFSPSTTREILAWRAHLGDEPIDDLSEFGWLCECQDWDSRRFRAIFLRSKPLDAQRVEAMVEVRAMPGSRKTQRLVLRRFGSIWKVENLFSKSMPEGLLDALKRAVSALPGST